MAEALSLLGMEVLIVEKQKNILPNLDDDMARLVENYLLQKGIQIRNDSSVLRFEGEGKVKEAVLSDKSKIPADFVLISVGVRPNTEFLKDSGIELLENGAIKVDEYMRTNIEDIFAAGDCAAVYFKLMVRLCMCRLAQQQTKWEELLGRTQQAEI